MIEDVPMPRRPLEDDIRELTVPGKEFPAGTVIGGLVDEGPRRGAWHAQFEREGDTWYCIQLQDERLSDLRGAGSTPREAFEALMMQVDCETPFMALLLSELRSCLDEFGLAT